MSPRIRRHDLNRRCYLLVREKAFILCLIWILSWNHTESSRVPQSSKISVPVWPRGGNDGREPNEDRYSRQIYTLGAHFHSLVRQSAVYIDGPATSGLVYECAKNLALSGVNTIVLLKSNKKCDKHYHYADLDDLGNSYQRAARLELEELGMEAQSPMQLLKAYIERLNPTVSVLIESRATFLKDALAIKGRGVVMAIDRPYSSQVEVNHGARQQNIPFVAVETAGVYGRVMCDFGNSFLVEDADGETPVVVPLDRADNVGENQYMIHAVDGEKHDVSAGDLVQFIQRSGQPMEQKCMVVEVQTPYRILVSTEHVHGCDFADYITEHAAAFVRIKVPKELTFAPINDALEHAKQSSSLFTSCDLDKSWDETRRNTLMSCFQALSAFVDQNHQLPDNIMDEVSFETLAKMAWHCDDGKVIDSKVQGGHIHRFLRTSRAKFAPLQAVFGAIASQEALKAVTGLYHPIRQILLYDCDEVLMTNTEEDMQLKHIDTASSSGLRHILGSLTVERLSNKNIFVVGAGAIGCELLKNLAAMGVGSGESGSIVLTDMDTIEVSNLSRQLLFRDADVGKFKSVAARDAALRFNQVKIAAHSSKVGDAGPTVFDDTFWASKVDIVLNALDNVEARLYMDSQCIAYSKALIDAGTQGPKGNTQVVVPFQSESYASSVDPPEQAIPVCTLKNFPYAIAHTIQWSRDLFEGQFRRRAAQTNKYLKALLSSSSFDVSHRLINELGEEEALRVASELLEDAELTNILHIDKNVELRSSALSWAASLAVDLFRDSSLELLRMHPRDSADDDGEPFWSGTRRTPKVLFYQDWSQNEAEQLKINVNLLNFVKQGTLLRLENILNDETRCASPVSIEEARNALVLATDDVGFSQDESVTSRAEDCTTAEIKQLLDELQVVPTTQLKEIEFEKDNDTNGHVAFITAASNLRAIGYGIPPVDEMETRRIAGRIVPAMITTTAFVAGLSSIELVKLVQNAPLQFYRNAFINLALPFFAFTTPLVAEPRPGFRGRDYTLWDHLVINEGRNAAVKGGITLRSLLRRITRKCTDEPETVEVASVSFGPLMLYVNFLHQEDREVLNASLWELMMQATADGQDEFEGKDEHMTMNYSASHKHVELTVVVEDVKSGDEVELPPVRVVKYRG